MIQNIEHAESDVVSENVPFRLCTAPITEGELNEHINTLINSELLSSHFREILVSKSNRLKSINS